MYRLLLLAYPTRFRNAYRSELLAAFRDQRLEARYAARVIGGMRFWGDIMSDLIASAARRRIAGMSRRSVPVGRDDRRWRGRVGPLEVLMRDMRYALRSLARSPGFTAVAILTVSLGIGANTAIFSVVNGVLRRPLPFADPDRVILTWSEHRNQQIDDDLITMLDSDAWNEQTELFEGFAASVHWGLALRTDAASIDVKTMLVTPNLFEVLGAKAALGRTLVLGEDTPGRHRVAVISHGFWQRQFGADSAVVGSTITLDGEPFTLVGVMPPGFMFPDEQREMWVPLSLEVHGFGKAVRMFPVVGRLRPGVTIAQAEEELSRISQGLAEIYPASHEGWTIRATTLLDSVVGQTRFALLLLQAVVVLVLLVECANVASLVMARTTGRSHEIAIRTALGAGRGRLMRQLVTENMVLATIGGILGIAVAVGGLGWIVSFAPDGLPRVDQIRIDASVLVFGVLLSALTGLVFGTVPALRFSAANPADSLKESTVRTGGGLSRSHMRSSIVVVEHAVAVVLLIGAGLLLRTFAKLQNVDTGFAKENLVAATIYLQDDRYGTAERWVTYYETLARRLEDIDGVLAVGATNALPMHPVAQTFSVEFAIVGRPETHDEFTQAGFRIVAADYFVATGIPLLAGRVLSERDRAGAPDVVVISQAMARRYWPDGSPLGAQVQFGFRGTRTAEVVGVVGDVRHDGLRTTPSPEMYVAFAQAPICGCLTVVARTSMDPSALVPTISATILDVDPTQPAYRIDTVNEMLDGEVALERFVATLVGVFAVVALMLAGIGMYGVLSYSVSQSKHEIGVRTALGAGRRTVVGLILGRGLTLAAFGTLTGFAGAVVLGRVIESLVYGVSVTDTATYGVILGVSVSVAVLASYLPAVRAARVDPVRALRQE